MPEKKVVFIKRQNICRSSRAKMEVNELNGII